MRTMYRTPEKYAAEALRLARETKAAGSRRPEKFRKAMRENRGALNVFTPFLENRTGMERKNPLIVALGDSVTAGHFEFNGDPAELFAKADAGGLGPDDAIEITDARECYLERFRLKLIDYYEMTSVSTVNSGIAGDNLYGMQKRLYRDVIRYQPDLVLINASLNWPEPCGDTAVYEKMLSEIVETVKEETKSDIILMTPNMELHPEGQPGNPVSTLAERVGVIRRIADKSEVCLADTWAVWEKYRDLGYPVKALLANGLNHPSVTGHEMFAEVLMHLIREER